MERGGFRRLAILPGLRPPSRPSISPLHSRALSAPRLVTHLDFRHLARLVVLWFVPLRSLLFRFLFSLAAAAEEFGKKKLVFKFEVRNQILMKG